MDNGEVEYSDVNVNGKDRLGDIGVRWGLGLGLIQSVEVCKVAS